MEDKKVSTISEDEFESLIEEFDKTNAKDKAKLTELKRKIFNYLCETNDLSQERFCIIWAKAIELSEYNHIEGFNSVLEEFYDLVVFVEKLKKCK